VTADPVRTESATPAAGGETVRTREPHPLAHCKRFELRVQPRQLAAWKQLAESQCVPVADMVREAMDFTAANMPDGYIKAKRAAEHEALSAAVRGAMAGREAP